MTYLPPQPNRQPIMASRLTNAYKAYARPAVAAGVGRAGPAAGRAPAAAPPAAPDAPLQEGEDVMVCLQELLATLHQRGEQETQEFKDLFAQYRRLSTLIKQGKAQPAETV